MRTTALAIGLSFALLVAVLLWGKRGHDADPSLPSIRYGWTR